jgi:prolyl 4-hydroxylase
MIIDDELLATVKDWLERGAPLPLVSDELKERGYAKDEISNIFKLVNAVPEPYKPDYESIANRNLNKGFKQVKNPHVQLFVYENFLTPEFCDSTCSLIRERSKPSLVMSKEGLPIPDTTRVSNTVIFDDDLAWIDQNFSELLQHFAKLPAICGEALQGQWYETDGFYDTHCDYFDDDDILCDTPTEAFGQRTWTCMLYLNDELLGGETFFSDLGIELTPKRGMAVLWNNLTNTGKPNPYTKHSAEPVTQGEKFILTKWYRTFPAKLDS